MPVGQKAGDNLIMDPQNKTRIGRGTECTIMLTDALCSRVHAVLNREDGAWWVRDSNSRNGTFVNGQKIDEAVLDEGHNLRVGTTEFVFHQSLQPPTVGPVADLNLTQTLIKETRVGAALADSFALPALHESEQAQELLLLYQLTIKLLGCSDPNELMRISLDLLKDRTKASVVGFLWASDAGKLT